jgi:hypothetical protein
LVRLALAPMAAAVFVCRPVVRRALNPTKDTEHETWLYRRRFYRIQ